MLNAFKTIIEEHIYFKHQILKLAKSDLIKTYRGAAFGWAWALIKPIITLSVFWFAFTVGLRHGKAVEGYPYFLWLTAGFLPWFYMQELITGGAGCIRSYSHLVTKMKFPVSVIPTYYNMSHLFVHWALLAVAIILFACFGFYPDRYMLQIPFYMLLMFLFFTVWSLFAGLMSSMSKDFQNLVKSFSTAIFWMSGIIYNVDGIRNPTIRLILKFNPVTVVAGGYRKSFIYKKWFFEDPTELACYSATLLLFVLMALWAFKKLRKEIPDVL